MLLFPFHRWRNWGSESMLLRLSLQLCPTLCDPIDGSPPGSTIPGILQARTLEWVAISFSNAWQWKVKVKSLSRVRLLATPWTAAYQAPPSMGFSRQEYWSGVPPELLKFTQLNNGVTRMTPVYLIAQLDIMLYINAWLLPASYDHSRILSFNLASLKFESYSFLPEKETRFGTNCCFWI